MLLFFPFSFYFFIIISYTIFFSFASLLFIPHILLNSFRFSHSVLCKLKTLKEPFSHARAPKKTLQTIRVVFGRNMPLFGSAHGKDLKNRSAMEEGGGSEPPTKQYIWTVIEVNFFFLREKNIFFGIPLYTLG